MTLLQTAHATLATWKIPCTMSYNVQAWLTFGTHQFGLWIHAPVWAVVIRMMRPAIWNMEWLPTLP
jgi:hypothetical protein